MVFLSLPYVCRNRSLARVYVVPFPSPVPPTRRRYLFLGFFIPSPLVIRFSRAPLLGDELLQSPITACLPRPAQG